jgi:hypothetical protein
LCLAGGIAVPTDSLSVILPYLYAIFSGPFSDKPGAVGNRLRFTRYVASCPRIADTGASRKEREQKEGTEEDAQWS